MLKKHYAGGLFGEEKASLENLLSQIKTGWDLSLSKKIKPTGYIGYCLTMYKEDDATINCDIYAKTLDNLIEKLSFYLKKT